MVTHRDENDDDEDGRSAPQPRFVRLETDTPQREPTAEMIQAVMTPPSGFPLELDVTELDMYDRVSRVTAYFVAGQQDAALHEQQGFLSVVTIIASIPLELMLWGPEGWISGRVSVRRAVPWSDPSTQFYRNVNRMTLSVPPFMETVPTDIAVTCFELP
jgi:hypothetical protein